MTTLTLDDDVASGLHREARRRGIALRTVVNEAIRVGLEAQATTVLVPFKVESYNLGLREGVEIDSISELIDRLDGPLSR